ncbi:unnamed protein product, partial [Iphiclides podalirius]
MDVVSPVRALASNTESCVSPPQWQFVARTLIRLHKLGQLSGVTKAAQKVYDGRKAAAGYLGSSRPAYTSPRVAFFLSAASLCTRKPPAALPSHIIKPMRGLTGLFIATVQIKRQESDSK